MPHFVYIIECQNGHYYTGYTTDMERRYQEHVKGSAKCRYTRSFPPKKLAAYWQMQSKSDALVVERQIKKLAKREKQALIDRFQNSANNQTPCITSK